MDAKRAILTGVIVLLAVVLLIVLGRLKLTSQRAEAFRLILMGLAAATATAFPMILLRY